MEDREVLVFDDGCPTCSLGVRAMMALRTDQPVRPVGMNSPEGKKLVARHGLRMNESAYLIDTQGAVIEKEAMAASVLTRAGALGKLLSIPFRIPYVSRMLYTMLAWVRFHTTTTKR